MIKICAFKEKEKWCTRKFFIRFKCEFEGENNGKRSGNTLLNL